MSVIAVCDWCSCDIVLTELSHIHHSSDCTDDVSFDGLEDIVHVLTCPHILHFHDHCCPYCIYEYVEAL
jgi:hypothetical protein